MSENTQWLFNVPTMCLASGRAFSGLSVPYSADNSVSHHSLIWSFSNKLEIPISLLSHFLSFSLLSFLCPFFLLSSSFLLPTFFPFPWSLLSPVLVPSPLLLHFPFSSRYLHSVLSPSLLPLFISLFLNFFSCLLPLFLVSLLPFPFSFSFLFTTPSLPSSFYFPSLPSRILFILPSLLSQKWLSSFFLQPDTCSLWTQCHLLQEAVLRQARDLFCCHRHHTAGVMCSLMIHKLYKTRLCGTPCCGPRN